MAVVSVRWRVGIVIHSSLAKHNVFRLRRPKTLLAHEYSTPLIHNSAIFCLSFEPNPWRHLNYIQIFGQSLDGMLFIYTQNHFILTTIKNMFY